VWTIGGVNGAGRVKWTALNKETTNHVDLGMCGKELHIRRNPAAAANDSTVFVAGGAYDRTMHVFDIASMAWKEDIVMPLNIHRVTRFAMIAVTNSVVAVVLNTELLVYDLGSKQWTETFLPSARRPYVRWQGCNIINNNIVRIGCLSPLGCGGDISSYNIATDEWSVITQFPGTVQEFDYCIGGPTTCAMIGTALIIPPTAGGRDNPMTDVTASRNVAMFNLLNGTLTKFPPTIKARTGSTIIKHGTRLFIAGGTMMQSVEHIPFDFFWTTCTNHAFPLVYRRAASACVHCFNRTRCLPTELVLYILGMEIYSSLVLG